MRTTEGEEGLETDSGLAQTLFTALSFTEVYLLQFPTWVYFNKLIRTDEGWILSSGWKNLCFDSLALVARQRLFPR